MLTKYQKTLLYKCKRKEVKNMKKQYRKEFDYGKQMRDFAWRIYNKNHSVKVDFCDYEREIGKYVVIWHYE